MSQALNYSWFQAHKHGLYGAQYAWIVVHWYPHDWWTLADSNTDCTPKQLLDAINGIFYMGMTYANPRNERGLAGVNYTELVELFDEATKGRVVPGKEKVSSQFDALWTVALALNKTVTTLKESGRHQNVLYLNRVPHGLFTLGKVGTLRCQLFAYYSSIHSSRTAPCGR